jgi:hypothetical protein
MATAGLFRSHLLPAITRLHHRDASAQDVWLRMARSITMANPGQETLHVGECDLEFTGSRQGEAAWAWNSSAFYASKCGSYMPPLDDLPVLHFIEVATSRF